MRALLSVFLHVARGERTGLTRGAVLSVVTLLAGVGLLGLSGWFILAAAAAGLAGTGATFDVFRPGAMVRLLAFGRTTARYGERVFTHDATLRVLAGLRVRLLQHLAAAPFSRLERLRGALALNRLTADVDALDGITLRLVLPLGAAVLTQAVAALLLAWLATPAVALWLLAVHLMGGVAVLALGIRAAATPARLAERAGQALRARTVDLIRARDDLAVAGRLSTQEAHAMAADQRRRALRLRIDRIERGAGLALSLTSLAAVGGALALGLDALRAGQISAATAAIGPFAALGLAETLMPLRRAVAEVGRMADAARRVAPDLRPVPTAPAMARPAADAAQGLEIQGLAYCRAGATRAVVEGFSLTLHPGETVALTGPSGAGKSTILALAAGLITPDAGTITLAGAPLDNWPESALRTHLGLLPQRAALVGGSLRENLALAAPDADDATMQAALEQVMLWPAVAGRGGLDLRLADRGAGLSGGEARRLAIARVLLRRPEVLLLDEPTEGIDAETASRLLANLRAELPRTAIAVAAHRPLERDWADRCVTLS
ncbi:MAG: thiol reductant ABC exporter subunit CydC [Limimaricola sp.]|uniref:thiol reductant ABC exporter subunit CydC n=1 Tax=Limimaricola sp. TaxID=2211665 RepID=UPI001D317085|nr:thiol reductant ABC exporter subunit CydC [Limimaricola sp.]MBI1417524.1 thiol reductant ABC exporter subunit CydC [Limimaricola sp.]